jgi:regulatory protein YycI of two-component signal transduction system YycFG
MILTITSGAFLSSGSGWKMPMTVILVGLFVALNLFVFGVFLDSKSTGKGSTPLQVKKATKANNSDIESNENLPNPEESGIELPIL